MNSYATHTPYSDPGEWADWLAELPANPREIAACVRGLVAHYRVTPELPVGREQDRQARWVSDILGILHSRNAAPLSNARTLEQRFIGCCRDYALLTVAALRQHGIPARIRIGWAPYLNPDFAHDHVVAEWFEGGGWVRGDPEMAPVRFEFDTMDLPDGTFQMAAEAWRAYRAGKLNVGNYGVAPGLYGGPPMLRDYVLRELAALTESELLLWDRWGLMNVPFEEMTLPQLALLDDVAAALSEENPSRWQELAQQPDLRVPDTVQTFDFAGSFGATPLTGRRLEAHLGR